MPHISQIRQSKYLSQTDLTEGPIIVTIDQVYEEQIESDGRVQDKFVLSFIEDLKPMVLNAGNAQDIAMWLGAETTEQWTGQQIVVYRDPTVRMGTKVTGGIRTRAYEGNRPAYQQPQQPRQQPQHRPAPQQGGPRTMPASQVQRPPVQHSSQAEYDVRRQTQPPMHAPGARPIQRPQAVQHDAFDPNDGVAGNAGPVEEPGSFGQFHDGSM